MADIAKSGTPSVCTLKPPTNCQRTLIAASAIAAGDMVYITSAGKFDKASGAAANAAAKWWGMAGKAAASGQPCTAFHSVEFHYGASLTPGADYYLSDATAGAIEDATTTGGDVRCCKATSDTTVWVYPPK